MSHQYCTKEQAQLWVIQEANLNEQATADRIDALINAASVLVDRYTKRPAEYFKDRSADAASERRYRGEGKNYLRLGKWFGSDPAITSPIVSATSVYVHPENGWIYYNDQPSNDMPEYIPGELSRNFFCAGQLYVVTAKWGFEAVPDDIAMATALIAGKAWDIGKGVIGQIAPDGFVIERDMPKLAKTILDNWVRRDFELN